MLKGRLRGLINGLIYAHEAGGDLSSSTKGSEREAFINTILKSVIAPPFRVGSGDIIDTQGNHSGQLDIVIEHGGGISFPLVAHETPRLYLAESVCAVVEVKSNLPSQWSEVKSTADKLSKVKRLNVRNNSKQSEYDPLPLLAVGYKGWSSIETYKENIKDSGVAGILSIDPTIFVHSESFSGNHSGKEEEAIYGFILCLESATSDRFVKKPPFAKYKGLLR